MKTIKILGTGCPKCESMTGVVKAVVSKTSNGRTSSTNDVASDGR